MTNQEILDAILNTTTIKATTDFLEKFFDFKDHKIKWVPVGDRRNNISTINIGSDPAAGVTERITNAIDAVLEKEWQERGRPNDIFSPRAAVKEWFNIETGYIHDITDARDKRITDLNDKIEVTIRESEKPTHPTIQVRDKGIGLRAEDFKNTILSLNGNNKINKLHLMGAYGQGGSTALSYNHFTLIASKPYFRGKDEKPCISWTVVRINEGNVNKDKQPWYEYLIDPETKNPFTFEIDDEAFEPGTLVRHIHMDISKYKSTMTNLTGSLWYLAHHYLFDPVIPFTIADDRKELVRRTVSGNNRRLTTGETTEYQNSAEVTFRDGKIKIYYWVLSAEGVDDPRQRISLYTLPSQPIVITFNGQKQGTLPNTLIKNDLKLPYLERFIVVEVECDLMDNESKRQLFSSTRETLRDTSILDEIRRVTTEILMADDNLKVYDKARKARYLTRESSEALDKLKKRLANRITAVISGGAGGGAPSATGEKSPAETKKLPGIPYQDPPTFIEITSPSPKEIYSGKTFSVKFKTDAHENYIYNPDTFLAFVDPHGLGSYTGHTRIKDGYGIAHFKAREDLTVGEKATIMLEVRPPRQKSISDNIEVVVANLPENANPEKDGAKSVPNINPHWVDEIHPYYKEHSWDKSSVARVEMGDDGIDIFVSAVNNNLSKLIERAQRKGEEAVESIKNRYLEHISFYAYLNERNEFQTKDGEQIDSTIPTDVLESYKESNLKYASETICGMINDFFEMVLVESKEANE